MGGYHALLFLPLILSGKNRKYRDVVAENKFFPNQKEIAQILLTFILVVVGWIIFRAESIVDAGLYISKLLNYKVLKAPYLLCVIPSLRETFLLILFMVFVEWINRGEAFAFNPLKIKNKIFRYGFYCMLIFFVLFYYGSEQAFIYFQF